MKNVTFSRPQPGNRIKRSLLAFFSLGLGFASVAQTNITIGTGTGTTSNVPINSNWGYNYSQQIYYASDLLAQGISMGSFGKVRFYLNTVVPTNSQGWTIYMGHTAKTEFTSTTDWEPVANLTQVFSSDVTFPAAGNWMEITLATPFEWDGVSNIVIAIDENTPNFASSASTWRTTSATGNRSIYYRNDSNNPNPASPPTATGRQVAFANLQLEWTVAPDCAGTPAHALALAADDSICPNQTAALSLDQHYFAIGMTYQWQENPGAGWVDVTGATNATYTTPQLTASTDYRCIVGCSVAATADTSDVITIVVNPNPVVVIDFTEVATCNGEPANLTASGADTYLWTPTTLLTPSATSANVNVIPATTTTYTVTGTTAAGCSATATSKITPVSMVQGTPVYSPSENCAPGSPVTVQVTGLPATITSGGTWEYRFLASDSVTVLQDWSASDNYTFIPSADSVYGHFYQVRSTSCPDNYVDSVYTSIIVGFGADVELTHYNCNTMGGTIALENPFGQTEVTEIYSNPLSDLATMTAFTLSNNASVSGGRLQLTPSATAQTGYGQLTIPGFVAGLNNSMTVSFDMTADQPINTFGTGGADGITYSFGDDATPAANGSGPNGKGTKLRLSFDAAGNGSENNNQPGIYLVYGWTAGNAFGPASAQTLAYSPNTALWKIQTDIPVELSISTEGKATVTVNGTVVFSDIQLPAAYMTADVSTWKHLFSAGTGGDAMRQAVSNLDIEAGNLNYGIAPGNTANPPSDWQASTSFEDLLPGIYDIWISKDTIASCLKKIGTYEILNTNPVVELGNDTTICEGETLLLDAGNPGSVYTWSGSNTYTQTMEVSEEGSYIVYVTDTAGCLGIGTINVDVNEAPSATGIYAQGAFPTMFFSVTGSQNAADYDWNFGDGVTVNNGPASISHTYTNDGTFSVTVTLSNDCGTETYTQSITITDVTGIGENTIEGLTVYPNPASDNVTVSVPNGETSGISVYNVSGSLVQSAADFHATTTVDVSQWQKGIYFLHITNQGKTSVTKLVVQ
jgi:hypothetical protein